MTAQPMAPLTERERLVLDRRARSPRPTLAAIARELGISAQRVGELERQAQRKLAGLPARRAAKRCDLRIAKCVEPAMTLNEVAAELGVSRSRVEQIEANALAKLQSNRELRRTFREGGFEATDHFEPSPLD